MSTGAFGDSADVNAGLEGARPRSGLYYNNTLHCKLYIEKMFMDFLLLLQLFDGLVARALQRGIVPAGAGCNQTSTDAFYCSAHGHHASSWWDCVGSHALHLW